MYDKAAMTCFKYQVYLNTCYMYGSEAITYLKATLWVVTNPEIWIIRLPPPLLWMAAEPSPIWRRTLNHHTYVKKQGKTCMVKEPSREKKTISNKPV